MTTLRCAAGERQVEVGVFADHRRQCRLAVLDDEAGDVDFGIGSGCVQATASMAGA